tara:strand:- start:144 stop:266 length:123 start_codon:yes stop_codon:yes gene_type:complete
MKTRLGGGEEEDVVVAEAARRKSEHILSRALSRDRQGLLN